MKKKLTPLITNQRTQSKRKGYELLTSFVKAFLLITLAFGINSCKKDVLVPASIKAKETNGSKIQNITYSQFLNKVDLSSIGSLKPVLQSAASNGKLTNSNSSSPIYDIETGNVKELIISDTVSYVLALKPQTSRARHFQNITIQTAKGKTIAFLTTYFPDNRWIKEWRSNKHIDTVFRGETYANMINLSDIVSPNSKTNGTTKNSSNSTNSISIGGNTIKLMPGQCESISVYESILMPCGSAETPHYTTAECTYAGAYGDWPPYTKVIYLGQVWVCEPNTPQPPGGGGGGGGNTTPNPPVGYDPCDDQPTQNSFKQNGGFNLKTVPPNPCDEPNEPPFDENEPIGLPIGWDMELSEDWLELEDEYGISGALIAQSISGRTDPIPEMYYMNGIGIDMSPATPRSGRTVFGAPRNHQYFWKELVRIKPQMFDLANRSAIKAGGSPIINDQWLKYNPTHKSFKNGVLRHHHEGQGNIAYAIPERVHFKWSRILHQYRTTGKLPRVGGKVLSVFSIGANVASLFTGWLTGDPSAWINWYGGNKNEIGKVYYHPEKDCYWVINQKQETKVNGVLTRAIVTYDVFEDFIWDEDENKHMGVIKLGTFTEDIDVINGASTSVSFSKG